MKIDSLKFRELQRIAKLHGLTASGTKAVLIKRIQDYLDSNDIDPKSLDEPAEEEVEESASEEENEDDAEEEDDEEGEDEEGEDFEGEDEEGEDEEGDSDSEVDPNDYENGEIMGYLMAARRKDAESDEDDELIFVEFGDDEDEFDSEEDELVFDEDDDEDDFDEELYSPSQWARNTSNVLSIVEIFTFIIYAVMFNELQAAAANTENPADPEISNSGAEAFARGLVSHIVSIHFWQVLLYYVILFFVFPTIIGLVFGKYPTPESVFGFAVSRYAIFYLIGGLNNDFSNEFGREFHEKLFNVNVVVSLLMAYWERSSVF